METGHDEFTVAFTLSLPFEGGDRYTVEDVEQRVMNALRHAHLTPVGLDVLPYAAQLTVKDE